MKDKPTLEPTAKDALQAIADLPPVAKRKWDDELNADLNLRGAEVNGQETAYRAVEALFDKPPRIECKQPTPPDRKALIGIAQATIEKTIAFDPANTGTWDCAEAVINALLPHLTNPDPQGFDEWFKSLGDDPSKLGRVILPRDAYNAGYAASKPKAKTLEWEGYNSGPYEIRVRRGIADLFNHGLRDEYGYPEHLKCGYLTLISLDDLKGIAQAHYQALLDDMGGAQ